MTNAEALTYYADLLILQYRTKTRARETVKCLCNSATVDGLMAQEATCFDLETAEGAQLDVLARIVGVDRNVYGLDLSHEYWALTEYDGSPSGVGFQTYAGAEDPLYLFKRYRDDASFALSDFELRAIIKLKIVSNTQYMSLQFIKEKLYEYFAGDIDITDNADSTIEYDFVTAYHVVADVAEYLNILPRPMGVSMTVNKVT